MPITRRLTATALVLAAGAVAAPAASDAAAKPLPYAGKTKEGTKIAFVLDGPWVDGIGTQLPYSCVSAQGGPPVAGMTSWAPPYKFRLGSREVKVTVEEPWPTKNYTITVTGKKGRAIKGKLWVNWSMTVPHYGSSYRILTCQATGSFTARPTKR